MSCYAKKVSWTSVKDGTLLLASIPQKGKRWGYYLSNIYLKIGGKLV